MQKFGGLMERKAKNISSKAEIGKLGEKIST